LDKLACAKLVGAINDLQPYLPPIQFAQLCGLAVLGVITAIANGQMVATVAPAETPPASQGGS
jgi:hypothetical protein